MVRGAFGPTGPLFDSLRALFGTETEYAVTAVGRDESVLPPSWLGEQLSARAAEHPHLVGNESGVFLPNGGRFYIDTGHHPEYASPETTNPWDAVRYALAGDRFVSQLAQEVGRAESRIARMTVRKGNVDYASGVTWGSHENYLHRRPPAALRPALVPHLVSRLVFTGAGGFDPFERGHPQFVLSPRALFIRRPIGSSAADGRALVDDRSQPHCAGYSRQHLMCGDALQSHLATFLRIGTTALVVALVDAGCASDDDVALASPLAALATVTRDVTLRRPLALADGRPTTALHIQRHYLRHTLEHLDRLPQWAGAVCEVWRDTLNRLEQGPDAVADRLDWAIKLAVYRHRTAKRGIAWPGADAGDPEPSSDRLSSDEADKWRAELCEVDLRFGQVYPSSLFDDLEHAGVLRHRIVGVDEIDRAATTPPEEGRARIRGHVVTRLAGRASAFSCGWDGIRDQISLRTLDLTDPFTDSEAWSDLPATENTGDAVVAQLFRRLSAQPSSVERQSVRELAERLSDAGEHAPSRCSAQHAIDLNNRAMELRREGRLQEAEWLMRAALAIDLRVRPNSPKVPHRRNNLATVLMMQGRIAEAREQVTLAWQHSGPRYDVTSARVLTMRLAIALICVEPPEFFLGQLKSHLIVQPLPDFADVVRRWEAGCVLDALAPRLGRDALGVLQAIVAVLNAERAVESLEDVDGWRDAPPEPLDAPWPRSDR